MQYLYFPTITNGGDQSIIIEETLNTKLKKKDDDTIGYF